VWTKKPDSGVRERDTSPELRKGFCQRAENSAWLFTLNGQRFPTIKIKGGQNVLLRIGNLSANVAYWLELYCGNCEKRTLPLTIVSVDGVVPAMPVTVAEQQTSPRDTIPVFATPVNDLLLMPASRVEIFVRNDTHKHDEPLNYVLRTKRLDTGTDIWPEIQLATVELEPNPISSEVQVALNAPAAKILPGFFPQALPTVPRELPVGCVRDLKLGEYRRVTFKGSQLRGWRVATEIVHAPQGAGPFDEEKFEPDNSDDARIGNLDPVGNPLGVAFKEYELEHGAIDWTGQRHKHACIELNPGKTSHKQLWVLKNNTSALHNFHIHQIKFRLATATELQCTHKIKPPEISHTCPEPPEPCSEPDYKFYRDDREPGAAKEIKCDHKPDDKVSRDDRTPAARVESYDPLWHDTIPVPSKGPGVFLIMSFDDARHQVGRFVYHCHILKHEDRGLMAPIEVWDPSDVPVDR